MSNLQPTPIVDKNGRATTVHKRTDNGGASDARLSGAPSAGAVNSENKMGVMKDGGVYTLEGDAKFLQEKYPYIERNGAKVSEAFFEVGKNGSVRIDINKEHSSNPRESHDFKLLERDGKEKTTLYLGYNVDLDEIASSIPDGVANTPEGKRAALTGYLSGKYGAEVRTDDDGVDSVLIPTLEQNYGTDGAMQFGTTGLIDVYADYGSRNAGQFGSDLNQGFMSYNIERAFPKDAEPTPVPEPVYAESDPYGSPLRTVNLLEGAGLVASTESEAETYWGDRTFAIESEKYELTGPTWDKVKEIDANIKANPGYYSPEIAAYFDHMATYQPTTKTTDNGQLIYWEGLQMF
jgi:hypothetical protein